MKPLMRRLVATVLLPLLSAAVLLPVAAVCTHRSDADSRETRHEHAIAQPDTERSGRDAADCPLERGAAGCALSLSVPATASVVPGSALARLIVLTGFITPPPAQPASIFHPPRV